MSFYDDDDDELEIENEKQQDSVSEDYKQELRNKALEKFRNELSEKTSGKTNSDNNEQRKNNTLENKKNDKDYEDVSNKLNREFNRNIEKFNSQSTGMMRKPASSREGITSAAKGGVNSGTGLAGSTATGGGAVASTGSGAAASGAAGGSASLFANPWFWIIVIILIIILIIILLVAFDQDETIQPIMDLVERREKRYAESSDVTYEKEITNSDGTTTTEKRKPFILFTDKEIDELLYTSYYKLDSDDKVGSSFKNSISTRAALQFIAWKGTASNPYGVEDPCYNHILAGDDTNEIADLLSSLGADDSDSSGKDQLELASEFVKTCIKAEKNNFNAINWKFGNNNENEKNSKYTVVKKESFRSEDDFNTNSKKTTFSGTKSVTTEDIPKNKMKKYLKCDLEIPNIDDYPIVDTENYRSRFWFSKDENIEAKALMQYISLTEDHLLKWIVPFVLLTDTNGDNTWVNNIIGDAQSKLDMVIYKLQQLTKTIEKEYYLEVKTYYTFKVEYHETGIETVTVDYFGTPTLESRSYDRVYKTEEYNTKDNLYNNAHYVDESKNSKDDPVGSYGDSLPGELKLSGSENISNGYKKIADVKRVNELKKDGSGNYIVAKKDGKDMVKEIRVSRDLSLLKAVPKLVHVEDMYNILNREYEVDPINESNAPDEKEGNEDSPVQLVGDNVGKRTIVEKYNEKLSQTNYEAKRYSLSYMSNEQEEKLGRKISRIEWVQDFGRVTEGEPESSIDINTSDVTDAVWKALIDEGYPEVTVAAIMGNIQQESSFNFLSEDSAGAYGICQWQDGRRTSLQSFASGIGLSEADLEAQIKYLIKELNTPGTLNGYKGTVKSITELKCIDDIDKATEQFCWSFERPNDRWAYLAKRQAYARNWYEKYTGTYVASSSENSSSGTNTKVLFGQGNIYTMYPTKSTTEKRDTYDKYYGTRKTKKNTYVTKGYSYEDLTISFEYIEEAYKDLINKDFSMDDAIGSDGSINGNFVEGGGANFIGGGSGTLQRPVQSGVVTATMFYSGGKYHGAIDFGVPVGTTVYAADDGVVVQACYDGSYGYDVVIQHPNGLRTWYAHGNGTYFVAAGQSVVRGQPIMLSGNTGNSTGPHLHFEVRVPPYSWYRGGGDSRVDPRIYL